MDYPFECVLSKQYKDPEKMSEKLNEFFGEDGWNVKALDSQYIINTKKEVTEEQKKAIEEYSKNHY